MNKLLIALFFVCAMTDVVVGATPGQVTSNAWFRASVSEDTPNTNGCTITSTTIPQFTGNKFVIESELNSPVTFTAEQTTAKDYAEVTFVLDTTVVPELAELTGKKVAFAVFDDGNGRAYYAWFGSSWTKLSGTPSGTPKADGESYTLVVTFDNREGNKVQFKVDGTVLKDGSDEWIPYGGSAISNTMSIDLVGNGTLESFVGNQIEIVTEIVVPSDCGRIEIPEADMKLFRALAQTKGMNVDALMNSPAKVNIDKFATDNISVGAAYALGMIKKDTNNAIVAVDGGVLKATAVAQSEDKKNLALALNVEPPKDTGAQISYQVFKNGGDTAISNTLSIPKSELDEGLTKFTVKAIITKPTK